MRRVVAFLRHMIDSSGIAVSEVLEAVLSVSVVIPEG